jgi:glycosyltransferase involved in cell wall biosynthesis
MRVLFLARWYPTRASIYDGVFIREHAKAVRAAGDEVVVLHLSVASGGGRALWRMEEEVDPKLTEGIPTFHVFHRSVSMRRMAQISFWVSYGLYLWSAWRAARRLRGRGFRPDVVHAHVYGAAVPAVLIGKLLGTPVVVTEHSTDFSRGTLGKGPQKRARFAFTRAARVLPVCASLQEAIAAYGITADFEVVPNAVDTSKFFTAGWEARTSGPKRMMFVGNLEPTQHKGFPTLVAALRRLRERRSDWHLDVIGMGPSQAECERLVGEADLSVSVAFLGARPKEEIAEMMRTSDLFVLPSRFENQPCVLIEAMTSGLPVVSTRVGGIPEMVSERDGILVPPDDAAALAEALDRVLSNLSSFDRDDIAARARARYSLEAVGAQLHAVYASVLSTARRKTAVPESNPGPTES